MRHRSSILRPLLAACVAGLASVSVSHGQPATAVSVTPPSVENVSTVTAAWLLPIERDVKLVAGGTPLVLRPNLELVKRLCLSPDDVLQAELTLKLQPPAKGEAALLAEGRCADGERVALGDVASLQSMRLDAGAKLMLSVWRNQWHYQGGADVANVRLTRVADGASVALPALIDHAEVATEFGTFRLAGATKRGKFPVIEKQLPVVPGAKPGEWTIAEGKGASVRSAADGTLSMHTQGQAQAGNSYDAAPVLIFEPHRPGVYRLEGNLTVRSGQAADKSQPAAVSWMAMVSSVEKASRPARGTLQVHRLLRPFEAGTGLPIEGTDFDPTPLAAAAIDPAKPEVRLTGLAPMLSQWAAGAVPDHGLLVSIANTDGDAATPPRYTLMKGGISGSLGLRAHETFQIFTNPLRSTDGIYTVVKDGHLSYDGKRLRLWGVAGSVGDGGYDRAAQRLARLGFNALRMWGPGGQGSKGSPTYDAASTLKGTFRDPATLKAAERNYLDEYDRYIAACKAQGIFIMCPQLQNGFGREPLAQDGSFVSGGDDWAAWKAAILNTEAKGNVFWKALDERLIKAQRQHAVNFLTHVNPYTGKRYADEESIAVWEIHNEHFLIRQVLDNGIQTWPTYFQDKLRLRWNEWLKARHPDQAALVTAWGQLADGESLADGTIAPAPTFADRTKYPKARSEEFVAFLTDFITRYYKDYEAFCRSVGTPGKGVAVAPFSYDTQFRPNIPWNYSAGAQADVNNFGMYFWNITPSLDAPPSTYVMDSLTVAGKPTVIYETNSARPNPYRTERPFMNAALAGWQDWDAMFYHYYHSKNWPDEQFLATDLQYMTPSFYWSAVEIERDPTMLSAIALAGRAFINGYVQPAPDPVTYEVGRRGVSGYELWNGLSIGRATFERGAALRYVPEGDFTVRLSGAKEGDYQGRITHAVRSGEQIVWDWPAGRLLIDAPQVKAYVGRPPAGGGWHRFKDGIAVGGFANDFVTFALVSADGKPLVGPDAARQMFVNARRDARNTGFDMDMSIARTGGGHTNPVEQAKRIRSLGRAPVVEDVVPYTLAFPTQLTARFRGYDHIMRLAHERVIDGTNEVASDGRAFFMGVIDVQSRGGAVDTPQTTVAAPAVATASNGGVADVAAADAELAKVWNPLSHLTWADTYAAAHQALRNSPLVMTTVSPEDASNEPDKSIRLGDAEALFKMPANIEVRFDDGRMRAINATFSRPPAMADVLAAYEGQFGKPKERTVADVGFANSNIVWSIPQGRRTLSIRVTETQGTLTIEYALSP